MQGIGFRVQGLRCIGFGVEGVQEASLGGI